MTSFVSSSENIVIPANTSVWGNIAVSGANAYSAGLQNLGFMTNCYPTQLFLPNPNTIFYQIDNESDVAVSVIIWAVTDGTATLTGPTGTGSKALA